MAEEKVFKIVITRPAIIDYQGRVLPYLFEHFSYERAIEIDDSILKTAGTLDRSPHRGRIEKYLVGAKEEFRFILHKATKYFELKIIYFIDLVDSTVYVTDFFPTRMDPDKITNIK